MLFNKSWARPLALALGLPSTILGSAFVCKELYDRGILSAWVAVLICVLIVGNILFLMVYYAFNRKDKSS